MTTKPVSYLDLFLPKLDLQAEKAKIDEMFKLVDDHNEIKLKDAYTRNLIFVGKTKSGKSTAISVLKNPRHASSELQIFSETRSPKLTPFTVEYRSKNYNINIIDTPGLFEQYTKPEQIRDNTILQQAITTCLDSEITKIHLILFVCSFITGINEEEIASFAEFVRLFQGAENKIIMLITRSEDYTEGEKQNLSQQLDNHPKLQQLLKMTKARYFIGSLPQSTVAKAEASSVASKLNNVMQMRTELFNHIFNEEEPCQLTEITYFKQQQKKADELEAELIQLKQDLEEKKELPEQMAKLQEQVKETQNRYDRVAAFLGTRQGVVVSSETFPPLPTSSAGPSTLPTKAVLVLSPLIDKDKKA